MLADSSSHRVDAAENPLDRETLETLQALGYVAPRGMRESLGGIDPKDGMVFYTQLEDARHLAQREKWPEAEATLRALLAKLPENVTARNILALAMLRQERLNEAEAEYVRSLQTDPGQARVYAMLATIAITRGDLDGGLRFCDRALALSPSFVEAMANRGFILALRGDLQGAQSWYARAHAADPNFPRAWRRSADLYFERGDWAAALADYERALERRPDDFEAILQAGAAARRLGREAEAERWLRRAADLRGDSWLPRYNLACFEARRGNADAAIAFLDAALERGFHAARLLADDPDLVSLHGQPRFGELVRRAQENARRSGGNPETDE